MSNQVIYYNDFGKKFQEEILNCHEPAFWTTDYSQKGRIFQEMKRRIEEQYALIHSYFTNNSPVLDVGCGFGRQAFLLAQHGFEISGTDTSDVFIDIARQLFKKHSYKGNFYCIDILNNHSFTETFSQVMLLDVLEHIKPAQRSEMYMRLYKLSKPDAFIVVSVPHIKKRLNSRLNNTIRKTITQHFSYFAQREEHPYPIPSKKNITGFCKNLFEIIKINETIETDYYVLRRL